MGSSSGAAPIEVEGWVHHLGNWVERMPRLWMWLAERETSALRSRLDGVRISKPIYVTGLARSGSTILLEMLAGHPSVASHRYRDFPLVLAPWSWNWFIDRAAPAEVAPRERAHADGIAVTPESPEGFEELVWMAFFERLHDCCATAVLDAATEAVGFATFYGDHIRKLLLLRGGDRYLAKNNYNVTRLRYLLKLFPDARIVIPVRDPVWHVASLMKQHRLFCREEALDDRVLQHMRRSGHFEFGLDRRAINPGRGQTAAEIEVLWREGDEIRGWARYWNLVYGYVADLLDGDATVRAATRVVRYEDLCAAPAETFRQILEHCDLEAAGIPELATARIHAPDYYRPSFTPEEVALIREATQEAGQRFGYGAVTPAGAGSATSHGALR